MPILLLLGVLTNCIHSAYTTHTGQAKIPALLGENHANTNARPTKTRCRHQSAR